MYQNDPMKVLTGEVRLSYAHLTKPYAAQPGADEKYSVTLLIPKSDTTTKADIDSAITAAYEDGVSNKWSGSRPQLRYPVIYDGDGTRPSGEPFGVECRGHWVMTASSKLPPQVVHISNVRAQLAPSDIYSGMYARVTVRMFAYSASGNRGVGCGLGNVLKLRDGEPLSGHASAENDFAGIAAEYQQAPAAPVPTAQQPCTYSPVTGAINPITGQPYTVNPITGQPLAV